MVQLLFICRVCFACFTYFLKFNNLFPGKIKTTVKTSFLFLSFASPADSSLLSLKADADFTCGYV